MDHILKPLRWFYHEFGLHSIRLTGRDAYLIILARACRMFAFGTNTLILAIFFSALKFSDSRIGLFMTLTMLGDLFLGTFLTLVADRVGRRRVLIWGSGLMILSGVVFAYFENFWILLGAAILGVVSVTGGDFGPFRSIEESVLSQLTTPETRSDVLAWYVTTSTLGSSIGSEVGGRMIHALQKREGWREVDAYHALFWLYASMGVVNAALMLLLSERCELESGQAQYRKVAQDENEEAAEDCSNNVESTPNLQQMPVIQAPRTGLSKVLYWFTSRLTAISKPTRSVMYKLWFLLAVDSLADGMVPYALTNYYMDIKFHPAKSTLGDVTSVAYFIGAVTAVFAGPLAKKIGLINTMVFTHVPSSAAVLVFPFPPAFWATAVLLLVRAGLNNMDQAPRTAFIAAVVKADERTAVMGITAMVRTLAALTGPSVTGWLAGSEKFWIAFVLAGICRLSYDFGLWAMFVDMKLYQHEKKPEETADVLNSAWNRDEEESLEMESLVGSESSSEDANLVKVESKDDRANGGLRVLAGHERLRSRSPHKIMNTNS